MGTPGDRWRRTAWGAQRAGKVRLLEPEALHLTLCFLGARPVQELAPIAAAVQGIGAFDLRLSLGAPLWLPPRRPRSLALAVAIVTAGWGG